IYIGKDLDHARRVAGPQIEANQASTTTREGHWWEPRYSDANTPLVGGPHEIAEVLAGFAADGYTDVLLRHFLDDHAEVLASMERLHEVRALLGADRPEKAVADAPATGSLTKGVR